MTERQAGFSNVCSREVGVAADENTQNDSAENSFERRVSSLFGYLQVPIKQAQEWATGGQLESAMERLQAQAERAQEGVERRLRELNEVRRGVETHVKKRLEAYQREWSEEAEEPPESAVSAVIETQPPSVQAFNSEEPATEGITTESGEPKVRGAAKKTRRTPSKKTGGKRTSGRKR